MDKLLSLLGMCRRAGKLSCGHDASVNSIVSNKAMLCILTADASERLVREIDHAASFEGKTIAVLHTAYTMYDITLATGLKSAVLTVNDEGFAKRITELYGTAAKGQADDNQG